MSLQTLWRLSLWAAYPLVIFFGLRYLQVREMAVLLLLIFLLRHVQDVRRFVRTLTPVDLIVFISILALAAASAILNSEPLLRLYPVAMSLGMLASFAYTLRHPPSMIQRIAGSKVHMDAATAEYMRQVTQAWCLFLAGNSVAAAYTAIFSSQDVWALYNGLISYLLMGLLFVGEWLYRRQHLRRAEQP